MRWAGERHRFGVLVGEAGIGAQAAEDLNGEHASAHTTYLRGRPRTP
jgi:hypothetical protein